MNDTSPDIAQFYYELLMARSPAERLIMGSRMFSRARTMVVASLPPDRSR